MATDKKVNYEMQGKVKNYLGKQKMVKAPLHWRSGAKHPKTELAYITKKEKDLLIKKDLHKSLKGGVNRGPSGIISLNGWGDKGEGMADKSYGGNERPGGNVSVTTGNIHDAPQTVTRRTKTVSPKDHFEQSWSGPKGWFGSGGYRDLKTPGVTGGDNPYKSRWGGLGRGLLSLLGGIPGKVISGFMGLKNLPKHKTLSDWWKSRQGPDEEEEEFTSDYRINPVSKEYEYTGPELDYAKEFQRNHPLDLSNVNQNVNKFTDNVAPFTSYADQTKNFLSIPKVTAGENEFITNMYGMNAAKDGGRIGYRNGEFVDEDVNIQGPNFDVNENVEMAEGPSPFEMRIDELMDEGLSWEEAYNIASEEFSRAEGPEESFSQEGIASLV